MYPLVSETASALWREGERRWRMRLAGVGALILSLVHRQIYLVLAPVVLAPFLAVYRAPRAARSRLEDDD